MADYVFKVINQVAAGFVAGAQPAIHTQGDSSGHPVDLLSACNMVGLAVLRSTWSKSILRSPMFAVANPAARSRMSWRNTKLAGSGRSVETRLNIVPRRWNALGPEPQHGGNYHGDPAFHVPRAAAPCVAIEGLGIVSLA